MAAIYWDFNDNDRFWLTQTNGRSMKSAGKDQIAHLYRMILLFTCQEINLRKP